MLEDLINQYKMLSELSASWTQHSNFHLLLSVSAALGFCVYLFFLLSLPSLFSSTYYFPSSYCRPITPYHNFIMHFSTLTHALTVALIAASPLVVAHDTASGDVPRRFVVSYNTSLSPNLDIHTVTNTNPRAPPQTPPPPSQLPSVLSKSAVPITRIRAAKRLQLELKRTAELLQLQTVPVTRTRVGISVLGISKSKPGNRII
jgi:hypothetical protein